MKKRFERKLYKTIHNALLTVSCIAAYMSYIVAIFMLDKLPTWTVVKIVILSLSYLFFIAAVNKKLVIKVWESDED